MTLEQFRIAHSTLMEHYQFIEAHLEGIYARLSGKSFYEGLQEVENISISRVLREIEEQEEERHVAVFTEEERERIRRATSRRNFWCHDCYYELVFKRTGDRGPKRRSDIERLHRDLAEAAALRDELFEKKMQVDRAAEQNGN